MDIDYRKESSQLVYDLINRDNPDLKVPVSPDNCKLGTPVAITGQGIRNTQIPVMAVDGGFYMGASTLTYRRLAPLTMFAQGVPQLDDYAYPADLSGNNIKVEAVCRWVNQKYGTAFVPADFSTTVIGAAPALRGLVLMGNNPAWIGQLNVNRLASKKPVSEQVPEATPAVVALVSGAAPGGSQTNLADFMTYGTDFTKFKDLLNTFTALTIMANTAALRELVTYMAAVSGRPLDFDGVASVENGMAGCRIIRYALPNVNVPEANSVDYTHVAVVTPPVAGGWFAGRFFLHYKG
jgi:hypothetical protein